MAQVDTVKIIGNGPSRDLYRHTGYLYNEGEVVMCNICDLPNPPFWRDYISIVDRKTFDYLQNNKIELLTTIWTTPQLKELSDKWGWTTPVLPVYQEKLMNAAATAAYHVAQKPYNRIEIWGCDALWSDTVTSYCDRHIERHQRGKNLHLRWRDWWQKVWDTGKQFVIYHPKGIETIDYGENVKWQAVKK